MNKQFLQDLEQLDQIEEEQEDSQVQDIKQDYIITPTSTSNLNNNQQFLAHIDKVNQFINQKLDKNSLMVDEQQYALIIKSNQYAAIIDREISSIIKFIKTIYCNRFPELESIITNNIEYSKAVLQIQTKQKPEFKFLSSHQSISVTIAMSSPHPKLNSKDLNQILDASNLVLLLNQHHNLLMMYVESCMHIVAPNLCRLVGSTVASKLMANAGGINKLATMPACNIQVLGSERTPNLGLGMMARNHTGFFGSMDIVKKAPNQYQMQLVRMLSTNVAKCARLDYLRSSPNGIQGDKIKQQLLERFEKIQQSGPARYDKPLPIPDQKPKKRRGGKRYRKNKEDLAITQLRKYQNRMKFNEQQQQIQDGVGLGLIGKMGKVKINIQKTKKLNPSKKLQQVLKKNRQSGLESSLTFTPVQGMQLINPANKQFKKGPQTYFNKQSGFRTVLQQKLKKM